MIQKKPDIVAISETHLKEDDVLNYFGYIWEGENHRNARKADRGVGFLIKKDIQYKRLPTNKNFFEEGRTLSIEIKDT